MEQEGTVGGMRGELALSVCLTSQILRGHPAAYLVETPSKNDLHLQGLGLDAFLT